ncbi:MAG: helix-turn-helix domain-containing protein [Clostridia bacterium]|nr:helix-turn-helix domain-containing protein [Clostridia bacterium]
MQQVYEINKNFFYISYLNYDSEKYPGVKGSRRHKHNVAEIVFATEGSSLVSCGDTVRRVNAPYIVYCPAEMPHQQDNSACTSYTRWCFPIFLSDIGEAAGLPNQFLAVELNDFQCRQFAIYAEALYTFWGCREYELPSKQQNTSPHDLLRLKYLLLLFLNDLRPLIPDAVSSKSTYINDVCLFITEHRREPLLLDDIAKRFFVGRTTLTGAFRREMGMSVGEFITTVRVNHAKALLQENLTLADIAEQCGFSSVSYFIKVFIRHTGLSPTRYRAALEELPPE